MNPKVLVIDDERIIHTAFQRELGREGYEVDCALDGEEALEKARSKKYDLVFVGFPPVMAMYSIALPAALAFMTVGLIWWKIIGLY